MPAYAIAYLRDVNIGDDIIRYLREIDDTLKPFGGEYLVHGGKLDPREGDWHGDLVILRFPDADSAARWYESADYQRILPLRLNNSSSMAAIVQGVKPGHFGSDKLDEMLGH
ncbi:DUF1330 domain-containing protein [Mycolicibacterium sp. P9-64]|nr:DUF1330 domain-containing protein [Mycolicibacterium sp. P9-64]